MNTENSSPFGDGGGLYIHIPFCKQACHYCDFHFSTSFRKKEAMITALKEELRLRKAEFTHEKVATIYFGGGTPSVLELEEIDDLVATVFEHYDVEDKPEITLEANPDDLSLQKIQALAKSPVNRLSIGIQSFFDTDLKLMNRAHSADQASESLKNAIRYFDNISIDLIYGIPDMSLDRWKKNIEKALSFGVPHISSYALTIEPKTALANFVNKGLIRPASDEVAEEHFHLLYETLLQEGFVCYEISNFGKPGYFSQNNSAYWQQKKYIGVGPSAHSFDGERRGWNIGNNPKYIKALEKGELPMEIEVLSTKDKYNEYVMTGLRTIWGVDLARIQKEYGEKYREYILWQSKKFREEGLLTLQDTILSTTKNGKFLADGIAADLFMINLS
ncbi:radical SAM family heme chaperone HemW [Maribacter sp. 4G9]|uniref:radical SAM family heme chaperone HemW n=1 Tax=Maribacter sp. 4G9 TaxID=1889777 RepID=UPI000C15322E|nr:radical SAM family heme chaperone HemW [Maribacter sp. 4G9]PIB38724.1 coproporphyrinogen III oxidase [Maribacter sp. 4G9]